MKQITFNYHYSSGILPTLIRLFSRGRFNHTSITTDEYTYEAVEKGVIKTKSGDRKISTIVDAITIPVSEKTYNTCVAFLEKQVGKKYDFLGILSFVWIMFPPQMGRWYCSELAQVVLNKIVGLRSSEMNYQQKVTPYQHYLNARSIARVINQL